MLEKLRRFMGSVRTVYSMQTYAETVCEPTRIISREEQLRRFNNALFPLYYQAVRVREQGMSWRQFNVGCAIWAFREDASTHSDRWRVFYGMNSKILEGSRNICAEPIPLGAALASAYTEVIGVVIVGQTQEDERGITPLTLRPCAHCRLLMKNHPLIKPHTLVVTAHPPPEGREIDCISEVPHEVFTFEELLREYDELEPPCP